jgi:hypothetical protein
MLRESFSVNPDSQALDFGLTSDIVGRPDRGPMGEQLSGSDTDTSLAGSAGEP